MIREWASRNGHNRFSRGRISPAVKDAYDAAHRPTQMRELLCVEAVLAQTPGRTIIELTACGCSGLLTSR
ncbi:hypothetical protein [Curtobacterium flaccumfaciens]|uniref:Lsr2 family DNA-binding protein n=1 Tax=Curtobacterium flaccumfaciens TaxID=2035 RepID=UPI003AB3D07E